MSALLDSEDDFSYFDQMEIAKRLSFAVGYAFQRTYLGKDEFFQQLSSLRQLISEKKTWPCGFDADESIQMFLGSSYRNAKTARLIYEEAQNWTENPELCLKMMLVHHDLVNGIINPLFTAMKFLDQPVVTSSLGLEKGAVREAFEKAFGGNFQKARNALAHEDERMAVQEFERIQFRGSSGTKMVGLHGPASQGICFEFDFSETCFLEVVALLKDLITKSKP